MSAKEFSKTKKNLTTPPDVQQGLYCTVATFCNAYSLIIPFHIHKALTSMNCFHWQMTIQFLRNSMQNILSHNYSFISLTAFSPTAAASPSMKSDWCLLHILNQIQNLVVWYNCIHSRTLYFLHRLIAILWIQRIYNSKVFFRIWKEEFFTKHRSSCTEVAVFRY